MASQLGGNRIRHGDVREDIGLRIHVAQRLEHLLAAAYCDQPIVNDCNSHMALRHFSRHRGRAVAAPAVGQWAASSRSPDTPSRQTGGRAPPFGRPYLEWSIRDPAPAVFSVNSCTFFLMHRRADVRLTSLWTFVARLPLAAVVRRARRDVVPLRRASAGTRA